MTGFSKTKGLLEWSAIYVYTCICIYIYKSFFLNFWPWTDSCMPLRNTATEQKATWASKWFLNDDLQKKREKPNQSNQFNQFNQSTQLVSLVHLHFRPQSPGWRPGVFSVVEMLLRCHQEWSARCFAYAANIISRCNTETFISLP